MIAGIVGLITDIITCLTSFFWKAAVTLFEQSDTVSG